MILKLFLKTMLRREHCRSVTNLLAASIVGFCDCFYFLTTILVFYVHTECFRFYFTFRLVTVKQSNFPTFRRTRISKGKTNSFFFCLKFSFRRTHCSAPQFRVPLSCILLAVKKLNYFLFDIYTK